MRDILIGLVSPRTCDPPPLFLTITWTHHFAELEEEQRCQIEVTGGQWWWCTWGSSGLTYVSCRVREVWVGEGGVLMVGFVPLLSVSMVTEVVCHM